ncbi:MAG: SAM-dependent methyltransferase [Geobacter sp.]|nr:SAM-dependent methyltransferase [Geobacter sp.]
MNSATLNNSGCLLCGADLVYREQAYSLSCALCGEKLMTHAACANGHFICDRCHSLSALDLIEQTCNASADIDPLRLAVALMANPNIKMHGPEHHYLVPAVLITAWCAVSGDESKGEKLAIARKRAEDVKGGFCGFHGTCGAAMGAGVACSVLTGATPLAREEWRLSNLMTAACLTAIGEAGGPRCCKRDTFLALLTARNFLNRHLNAGLPEGSLPVCSFSANNRECLAAGCSFYPATAHKG